MTNNARKGFEGKNSKTKHFVVGIDDGDVTPPPPPSLFKLVCRFLFWFSLSFLLHLPASLCNNSTSPNPGSAGATYSDFFCRHCASEQRSTLLNYGAVLFCFVFDSIDPGTRQHSHRTTLNHHNLFFPFMPLQKERMWAFHRTFWIFFPLFYGEVKGHHQMQQHFVHQSKLGPCFILFEQVSCGFTCLPPINWYYIMWTRCTVYETLTLLLLLDLT